MNFREILDTLTRNKTRSLLTGFGVFWGVFMLILLIGGAGFLYGRLSSDYSPQQLQFQGGEQVPAAGVTQRRYAPRVRYTEMYLDYAEAANEAWGPKATGSHAYSAYDVIKAIRQRAGVGGTDDPYLEECAADQAAMRELIRNERRLELCFESFRFWDVRRWKLDLNEPVYGMQWNGSSYDRILVEERSYEDYMYFSPIPNSETLKYSNLIQNEGWD